MHTLIELLPTSCRYIPTSLIDAEIQIGPNVVHVNVLHWDEILIDQEDDEYDVHYALDVQLHDGEIIQLHS